ncbi:unnamed protein product, partial [Polarella glacialis]
MAPAAAKKKQQRLSSSLGSKMCSDPRLVAASVLAVAPFCGAAWTSGRMGRMQDELNGLLASAEAQRLEVE